MKPSTTIRLRQTEARARQDRLERQIRDWRMSLVGDVRRDRPILDQIVAAAAELHRLRGSSTGEP